MTDPAEVADNFIDAVWAMRGRLCFFLGFAAALWLVWAF